MNESQAKLNYQKELITKRNGLTMYRSDDICNYCQVKKKMCRECFVAGGEEYCFIGREVVVNA